MMKKILALICLCASVAFATPQKVIFDTDMGNDCDDVLAQLMLFNYAKKGDIELLCIAINKDNPYSPRFTRLLTEWYNLEKTPIYAIKDGMAKKDGAFTRRTIEEKNADGSARFPLKNKDEVFEDSIKGLRKTLAGQPDKSVVYISVGFLSNIVRLMKSQPDEISPLSGKELIAKKIKMFSIMGGGFEPDRFCNRPLAIYPEYNIKVDIPASKYFFENITTPVVLSPFEVGLYLRFPFHTVKYELDGGENNPASFACEAYVWGCFRGMRDTLELNRYMWDLTSVLYVLEPHYFAISTTGDVFVDDKGITHFKPNAKGYIRYLILQELQKAPIVNRCAELCRVKR